jgi:hypothetical protein
MLVLGMWQIPARRDKAARAMPNHITTKGEQKSERSESYDKS